MLEEVYQLQLRIAGETRTPVADLRRILEALAPDGIPGNSLYLDHVHPTIGGSQRMARAVAEKLAEAGVFRGAAWSGEARRAEYRRHLASLGSGYFTNGRRRVEWLENWARRQRLQAETEPRDARGFLHLGIRVLDLGDEEAAWENFQAALKKNPGTARELVAHALELRDQGRPEAGIGLLARLGGLVSDPAVKAGVQQIAGDLAADMRREDGAR
jgi:tetratricopeptide (TPR) repeat protein